MSNGVKFSDVAKLRDGVIPRGTTVWKKLRDSTIAELIVLEDGLIPESSRLQIQSKTKLMAGGNYRKCRVPAAYVVALYPSSWNTSCTPITEGRSDYDYNFVYKLNEVVRPREYDTSEFIVCTNGLHVFLTRGEAEAYQF
mgnify:CR=1 FL=1